MRAPRDRRRALAAASIALLASCVALPEDSASTQVQEIANGTVQPEGYLGMVRIHSAGATPTADIWTGGVALRNDWVLTIPGAYNDPSTLRVTVGAQTVAVDAAIPYFVKDTCENYVRARAALLHLATPLSLNGSTTGYRRLISTVSPYDRSILCVGYGDGTGSSSGSSSLPLTSGTFIPTAKSCDGSTFEVRPNAAGQTPHYDHGSVCFDGDKVMGVDWWDSVYPDGDGAEYTWGAEFSRWADATMSEGAPPNDTRATAQQLGFFYTPNNDAIAWGSTVGATHDGPSVSCACTSGPDIWYRFHVEGDTPILYYFDTSGSSFDTSLTVTDASGVPVAGNALSPAGALCNDDALCATGGFTSIRQSRIAGIFGRGDWYVVVGGCGSGRVVLHTQRMPIGNQWDRMGAMTVAAARKMATEPLVGSGTVSGITEGGPGGYAGACCGPDTSGDGAERYHWFVSCGGQSERFSLCPSDGGSYTRRYTHPVLGAYADFDPALYVDSVVGPTRSLCNDNGGTNGGTNCMGTGGDSQHFGSRVTVPNQGRGLHFVYVDERTKGKVLALYPPRTYRGMGYTLAYSIR